MAKNDWENHCRRLGCKVQPEEQPRAVGSFGNHGRTAERTQDTAAWVEGPHGRTADTPDTAAWVEGPHGWITDTQGAAAWIEGPHRKTADRGLTWGTVKRAHDTAMWVEGHDGRIADAQYTGAWVEGQTLRTQQCGSKDLTEELQTLRTLRMQQCGSKDLTEELQTAGMIWAIVRNKQDKGWLWMM